MLKRIYDRSEILFTVIAILFYVIGTSYMDQFSMDFGMEMLFTLFYDLALFLFLFTFIKKHGFLDYYGFKRPVKPAGFFLYYTPLILLASVNVWFGFVMRKDALATVVYVFAMCVVGATEELLFRGFLFQAMAKKSLRNAIILTSILFGIGHIVNLINGSGQSTLESICQVFYAVSIGFLLAAVLYRGKSIIPGMIMHGIFNALSVFSNEAMFELYQIHVSVALCILSTLSAVYLLKKKEA